MEKINSGDMVEMLSIIEMLKNTEIKLKNELKVNCITFTPFVIRCGGLYVSPDFGPDGKTTGKVKLNTTPIKSTRFNKTAAITIAKGVSNANGEKGEIIRYI